MTSATQTNEAFLPEKVILVCCFDHVQLRFSSIMHTSYLKIGLYFTAALS